MKIKKLSKIRFALVSKIIRFLNRLENDGNPVMETNGEKDFIRSFREANKNKNKVVVFDIGANDGEYSLEILSSNPKNKTNFEIHVFEPSNAFVPLKKTFEGMKNIKCNNIGLSNTKEERQMFADKDGSKLTTLYSRNRASYKTKWAPSITSTFIKASDYIRQNEIHHINLVKIDVEGHELFVLQGFEKFLNNNFIDYIQFEYSEANMDSHTTLYELFDILEKAGFIVCKMMPKYLQIRKYSRGYEHYNYSNWVAINPLQINI